MSADAAGFLFWSVLFILSAVILAIWLEEGERPPRWLLAAWAVFAVPVLFKAWIAVVLS